MSTSTLPAESSGSCFVCYISIFLGLLSILAAVFVFLRSRGHLDFLVVDPSKTERCVLFLGATCSGKTTAFMRLKGQKVKTVPSTDLNVAYFPIRDKKLLIRDIPGNNRFRTSALEYVPLAREIVFFIDASDEKSLSVAAEYLFSILTCSSLASDCILFLAVHKSDLPIALSVDTTIKRLEDELTSLKKSKNILLEGQKAEDVYLGEKNQAFKFDHAPIEVRHASTSTSNLAPIVNFLKEF